MSPDRTDQARSDATASDELSAETEAGEPRVIDRTDVIDSQPEGDHDVSLVDPLFYAPLILVGALLVAIPEPATSVLGVVCIAAGVFLAAVDVLSASKSTT